MFPKTLRLSRFTLLGSCLLIAAAWPATPAGAAVLHVVIAADSGAPGIGPAMTENKYLIQNAVVANAGQAVRNIQMLPPESCRSAGITRAIAELPVRPGDAILFYYSGHGAYDPARGTYLLPSGDGGRPGLYLADLRRLIAARAPRSATIVLDCCNTVRPVPGGMTPANPFHPPSGGFSPAFYQLFFQATGLRAIVSSSPGEYAVVLPALQIAGGGVHPSPSIFTKAFANVLEDVTLRQPSWDRVVAATQEEVDTLFRQVCGGGVIPLGTGPVRQARQTISHRAY